MKSCSGSTSMVTKRPSFVRKLLFCHLMFLNFKKSVKTFTIFWVNFYPKITYFEQFHVLLAKYLIFGYSMLSPKKPTIFTLCVQRSQSYTHMYFKWPRPQNIPYPWSLLSRSLVTIDMTTSVRLSSFKLDSETIHM